MITLLFGLRIKENATFYIINYIEKLNITFLIRTLKMKFLTYFYL